MSDNANTIDGSSYIKSPISESDFENNAKFQFNNVAGWMSVNEYECALIKAKCLVESLEELLSFRLGKPRPDFTTLPLASNADISKTAF